MLTQAQHGRVKSALYAWAYTLDPIAPTVATKDDFWQISDAFNHTVHIERVEDTLMVIDQTSLMQVGTLAGSFEAAVDAVYPDMNDESNKAMA